MHRQQCLRLPLVLLLLVASDLATVVSVLAPEPAPLLELEPELAGPAFQDRVLEYNQFLIALHMVASDLAIACWGRKASEGNQPDTWAGSQAFVDIGTRDNMAFAPGAFAACQADNRAYLAFVAIETWVASVRPVD